jgi:hypothetical protein
MPSALHALLPRPRLRELDHVAVATSAERTWEVVRGSDLYDVRMVRALFAARTLPERVGDWLRGSPFAAAPRSAHLDEIVSDRSGFHCLADVPGREFVAGAIGKFWQPTIPFVPTSAATFRDFHEPGFGKVAWALQVHPRAGGGSWITFDLRVDATDDEAWRSFLPYWTLIGRFSRLIRRVLLRHLADRLGAPIADPERGLAGDDILPDAGISRTDSITIDAPAWAVWPWLVQMGARRGGWYSIDALDNGGVASAPYVMPELQHIAVGDILPATPSSDVGFAVLSVAPERHLVLGSPRLLSASRQSWPPTTGMLGARYDVTWAFVLEPIGEDATRLVVRVRAAHPPSLTTDVVRPALLAMHGVMEHAQLRNLKRRAEELVQQHT